MILIAIIALLVMLLCAGVTMFYYRKELRKKWKVIISIILLGTAVTVTTSSIPKSVWFPESPGYEDFTDGWIEEDTGGHLDFTAYHIDHKGYRDEDCYLYKNKGVDYFTDFTHYINCKPVGAFGTYGASYCWMLTNDINDFNGLVVANKTAIGVGCWHSGSAPYMSLEESFNETRYTTTPVIWLTSGVQYYLNITKSGTFAELSVFDDAEMTSHVGASPSNLTLHSDHQFQYVFAANTYNDGAASKWIDVDIDNLDLSPPPSPNSVTLTSPEHEGTETSYSVDFKHNQTFYQTIQNATVRIANTTNVKIKCNWTDTYWNTTAVLNNTETTRNVDFSGLGQGSYKWNVQVFNSTHGLYAVSNRTLTIYITYYEDFLSDDWTEYDPTSKLGVNSTTVNYTNLQRSDSSYLVSDRGSGHFSGNFEFQIQSKVTSVSGNSIATVIALANTGTKDLNNLLGESDFIAIWWQKDPPFRMKIRAKVSGVQYSNDSTVVSEGTEYFITLDRVGDKISCYFRTGNHFSTPLDIITLSPSGKTSFQYIYACQALTSSGTVQISGWNKNLNLQEAQNTVTLNSPSSGTIKPIGNIDFNYTVTWYDSPKNASIQIFNSTDNSLVTTIWNTSKLLNASSNNQESHVFSQEQSYKWHAKYFNTLGSLWFSPTNWTLHIDEPPLYRNTGSNYSAIVAGAINYLHTEVKDGSGLDWCWLATNENSGNWFNYSTFSTDDINFTDEPSNPVMSPDDPWEGSLLHETSDFYHNGEYIRWYGANSAPYKIGFANSSDGVNWNEYSGNPILGDYEDRQYVVKDDLDHFYMFVKDESDGNLYLYNVTDYTNPIILNGGSPVYTHSTTTSDWDYQIYNPAVEIVNDVWHMILEGHALTGYFKIGYAYSNLTEMDWSAHRTSSAVITDPEGFNAGNPYLVHVPERNALLTVYGETMSPDWGIVGGWASLSDDLTSSSSWHRSDNLLIKETGKHIADPHMITNFNSTFPLMMSYGYTQNVIYQVYFALSLTEFYDRLVGVVYGSPMYMGGIADSWELANFAWRNVTITDDKIAWRIFGNDTTGNVNGTDVFNFTVGYHELSVGWTEMTAWSTDTGHSLGEINASLTYDNINWTQIGLEYVNGSRYVFIKDWGGDVNVQVQSTSDTLYILCDNADKWYHIYG